METTPQAIDVALEPQILPEKVWGHSQGRSDGFKKREALLGEAGGIFEELLLEGLKLPCAATQRANAKSTLVKVIESASRKGTWEKTGRF